MEYRAKFGSYLVIPLKFDGDWQTIGAGLPHQPMTTMDLNENIKVMLGGEGGAAVGRCCRVAAEVVRRAVTGDSAGQLAVCGEEAYSFDVADSFLYIFRTQVAFLCLGVTYDRIEALNALFTPGYAGGAAQVLCGHEPVALEARLGELCATWGLRKFFDGPSPLLLDSFVHTVAVVPDYFETLEELRRVTFRLHQMIPLESNMDDEAEEDTRYVYAVKNEERAAYRWGCCISSQTLSYAVADPDMDLAAELETQAADALPIAALMLQQKYTCLRFTELIANRQKKEARRLHRLKQMMLEFRAFATTAPANLSRWHNVRQIYAYLLEVNDIDAAVEDISTKLSILTGEQEQMESERSTRVVNIITIFGIVSILASVLSIIQILSGGGTIFWVSTGLTSLGLAVVMGLAFRVKK